MSACELLENCESLRGYMSFVNKVRDKKDAGMKPEDAVSQAVDECISEGILEEFFASHREEIVEMGIFEFDQELHDRVLREDSMDQGIVIGERRRLVAQVCKKVQKNQSVEKIAEDLVEDISVIRPIYSAVKESAPDYDPESVLRLLDAG